MNEQQANRIIELLTDISTKLDTQNESLGTLADALGSELTNMATTLDDIEQSVGTIVGTLDQEES